MISPPHRIFTQWILSPRRIHHSVSSILALHTIVAVDRGGGEIIYGTLPINVEQKRSKQNQSSVYGGTRYVRCRKSILLDFYNGPDDQWEAKAAVDAI